jgi:16S rRNA G966 N2-methylase RsmD
MGYGIYKMNQYTGKMTNLYEFIKDLKSADLLAQLAMTNKKDYELIFISPGYNRGIYKNPKEYKKALELAEKYIAKE